MHAPKLQKIDLARNRIAEVSDRAFYGLENLEILHLVKIFIKPFSFFLVSISPIFYEQLFV